VSTVGCIVSTEYRVCVCVLFSLHSIPYFVELCVVVEEEEEEEDFQDFHRYLLQLYIVILFFLKKIKRMSESGVMKASFDLKDIYIIMMGDVFNQTIWPIYRHGSIASPFSSIPYHQQWFVI
jgi:hypothetical protein